MMKIFLRFAICLAIPGLSLVFCATASATTLTVNSQILKAGVGKRRRLGGRIRSLAQRQQHGAGRVLRRLFGRFLLRHELQQHSPSRSHHHDRSECFGHASRQ